jgi:ORMDL family
MILEKTVSRPYSEKYVPGSSDYDLFKNKNVDWFSEGPFFKVFYVFIVLLVWFIVHITRVFNPADCWTVVNILHGVVRLRFMRGIVMFPYNRNVVSHSFLSLLYSYFLTLGYIPIVSLGERLPG